MRIHVHIGHVLVVPGHVSLVPGHTVHEKRTYNSDKHLYTTHLCIIQLSSYGNDQRKFISWLIITNNGSMAEHSPPIPQVKKQQQHESRNN